MPGQLGHGTPPSGGVPAIPVTSGDQALLARILKKRGSGGAHGATNRRFDKHIDFKVWAPLSLLPFVTTKLQPFTGENRCDPLGLSLYTTMLLLSGRGCGFRQASRSRS